MGLFNNSETTKALKEIQVALADRIKEAYPSISPKERDIKVEEILKIHGLNEDKFNVVDNFESIIEAEALADASIDDNSNKHEKGMTAAIFESINPYRKLVGYRNLYRAMKKEYGSEEAKRLSGLMYDYTLALSDSSKIMLPYCWAGDFSSLIIAGRSWGQLYSTPAKTIKSYIGALNETVHSLSNHLAGAVAIASFFTDSAKVLMDYEDISLENLKENKSIRKYVENSFQSFVHSMNSLTRTGGTECVTEDTEVMTPDGFKKYDELGVGDAIYTWKDGEMKVSEVQKVNSYDFDGEMHRYSGRDVIQQVTPNHRVFHRINNSKENKITFSSDLIDLKTPLTIPVAFEKFSVEDHNISDDLLELLTIIICDGTIKSDSSIRIYKSHKRYGRERIEELLDELEIDYVIKEKESNFETALNGDELNKHGDKKYPVTMYTLKGVREIVDMLGGTKTTLPKFFEQLSKRQSQLVLDVWSQFDGHKSKKDVEYGRSKLQVDNYEIAEQISHICIRAGKQPRISERLIGSNKTPTIYVIPHIRNAKSASVKEKVYYKGKVWCPTTEDGIVMFRKEGTVFISGNSPFTNISIFDRAKNLQKAKDLDFFFDKKDPDYIADYLMELQRIYMDFFSKGDPTKNGIMYRFPVSTINITKDENNDIVDKDFLEEVVRQEIFRYNIFVSESSKDASCCRMLSSEEMLALGAQSNSFGGGGVGQLGSHRVITVDYFRLGLMNETFDEYMESLLEALDDSCKILKAHRQMILDLQEKGFQPFIDRGYINMSRMFSTFGILGIVEGADIAQKKYKVNKDTYTRTVLEAVNKATFDLAHKYKMPINLEQIPAESMSHRIPNVNRILFGKRKCPYPLFANQFIPMWEDTSLWDRMEVDGKYGKMFTGGNIVHFSLGERTLPAQNKRIVEYAVKTGCEHFSLNPIYSVCEDCGNTKFAKLTSCDQCGSDKIEYFTRTVGFFTPVKAGWSKPKQEHDFKKRVFKSVEE